MKLSRYLLSGLALASLSTAAVGQVTVTPPNTVDAQGRSRPTGTTFIVNADGSIATIGGTTGTVTTPSDRVTTVQGTTPNGSAATGNPNLVAGSDGTNARTLRTGSDGSLNVNVVNAPRVQGTIDHGVADNGSPNKIGGFASASVPAAVATGQRVNAWYTLGGAAVTASAGGGGALDGLTSGAVQTFGAANNQGGALGTIGYVVNAGGTADRQRSANTAAGGDGTGLLGVGNLGFDGTNWRALNVTSGGILGIYAPIGLGAAVEGQVAAGATDSGRPVKIGGFASVNAPTVVAAGQRVNAWYGIAGQAIVGGQGTSGSDGQTQLSSITEPGGGSRPLWTVGGVFNGTSYDRQRDATSANATTGTGLLGAGILGQYTATLPTYTAGQYGTIAMSNRGLLYTLAVDGGGQPLQTLGGDADQRATTITAPYTNARNFLLNGTGWDRSRTVQGSDGTGAGVAAVSETPNSAAGAAIVPATALGATSLVGKASPGNLYGATVTASTAQTGAGYFIVANLAAAPASGTALTAAQVLYCVAVQPGATSSMGGTGVPDRGTVGLTALYSTSCATFTPQATAPLHMRLRAQ